MNKLPLILCAAGFLAGLSTVDAQSFSFKDFYVSVDGRSDQTGTYSAFQNPNFGRLTVTWAHAFPTGYNALGPSSNHYHRIGAIAHTGPAGSPTTTFFNRHIPEWNGTSPPAQNRFLRMTPGTGAFANKWVVTDTPDDPVADHSYYDNLTFASVHQQEAAALADSRLTGGNPSGGGLNAAGTAQLPAVAAPTRNADGTFVWSAGSLDANNRASTPVGWMYSSSAYLVPGSNPQRFESRYTRHFDDAQVALELVARDPKLKIYDVAGNQILNAAGSTQLLGTGRTWEFTPVFAVDNGDYVEGEALTATFRLVDLNTTNPLGSSGDFTFHVMVPEPSTVVLAAAGLLGLAGGGRWLRRRRQLAAQPAAGSGSVSSTVTSP